MAIKKPLKRCVGGFETDHNFEGEFFTKAEVRKRATERLSRAKLHGCTKAVIIDKGPYWVISIY